MKLSVKERLELLNILPQVGNVVMLRVVQDLRVEVGLSPEEVELIGVKQDGQQMTWDEIKDPMKDVTLGSAAVGVVVKALTDLDGAAKLKVGHLTLYDKFVGKPDRKE